MTLVRTRASNRVYDTSCLLSQPGSDATLLASRYSLVEKIEHSQSTYDLPCLTVFALISVTCHNNKEAYKNPPISQVHIQPYCPCIKQISILDLPSISQLFDPPGPISVLWHSLHGHVRRSYHEAESVHSRRTSLPP